MTGCFLRNYPAINETPVKASTSTIKKIMIKIAKKTLAMLRVPAATFVNPNKPATTEITKNINAHFNTIPYSPSRVFSQPRPPCYDLGYPLTGNIRLPDAASRLFVFICKFRPKDLMMPEKRVKGVSPGLRKNPYHLLEFFAGITVI